MARRVLTLGLLAAFTASSDAMEDDLFYPAGHFDRVEKITDFGLLLDFVGEKIESDKSVFARWIASTS